MPLVSPAKRPTALAIFLVFTGIVGLIAAFALTIEKFAAAADPGVKAGCDFSIVVQCGKNLASAQGSLFGFPNPLIGLVGFGVLAAIGMSILAGARFARWFWIALNVGMLAAFCFVVFLIITSIYFLGTLCPWCMVVWSVTIPAFIAVTLFNVTTGVIPLPSGARRVIGAAYGWVPFIAILSYIVIAVLAQLRLDVIAYL
ncbi:MAG: vitamin K epoxide reductase family protein [Burkholderiaceae bacterium]|nr:vitamin K epoxide reductase family protein [Microbacteriaceae bacterium]